MTGRLKHFKLLSTDDICDHLASTNSLNVNNKRHNAKELNLLNLQGKYMASTSMTLG